MGRTGKGADGCLIGSFERMNEPLTNNMDIV
jgi:hypothetical protein